MDVGIGGVFHILATPFTAALDVDVHSIATLVESVLGLGVDGVTALGIAGEAHKLTDSERARVVAKVVEVVAGRVPVIVGVSRNDTEATVQAAEVARKLGAAGLMIAPPKGSNAGPSLVAHYRAAGESVGLPIVLQDYPAANCVNLTPEQMAELVHAVPQITTIKLESPPTPVRIARTLARLPPGRTIVGGMGGVYLLDELRHGAAGTMTGFAYPEALIATCRAWQSGDFRSAKATYIRYQRLLVFEGQAGVGLAVRKEILRRRGFIANGAIRPPGDELDASTAADLSEIINDLGTVP